MITRYLIVTSSLALIEKFIDSFPWVKSVAPKGLAENNPYPLACQYVGYPGFSG
jgi:hypothetical protein